MPIPLASNDAEPQITACKIPSQAILDAHSLATIYHLPPTYVLQSAALLVSSIYNCSDVTTQVHANVTHNSRASSRLELDNVKVHSHELDQSCRFRDLAESIACEDAKDEQRPLLPADALLKQHRGIDALVCLYEFPEAVSIDFLDGRCGPQWTSLFNQFSCNIAICLPRLASMTDALFVHRSILPTGVTPTGLASTFAKVLSSALSRPACEIREMEYLGESDEILIHRRNEHVAEPKSACLHTTISSQAKIRPQAPAVCGVDGDLTHEELDSLSTRLAVNLVRKGLGRNSTIPLCFEKSKYMVVSMLAVLKIGAACTMLEASLPTERLQNMIQQVSASTILASSSQLSRFRNFIDTVEIGQSYFDQPDLPGDHILSQSHPSDVAIILFTSGSTGNPKGIMHEHVSINTSLHAIARRLKLDSSARIAQFAAYSFDLSMIEMLLPLVVGGCVCIPSEDSRINNLGRSMENMRVNFAMLTPSSIKLLQPQDIPSMRMIMVGGEPITGELIRIWERHITLINAWGPAEAGICSSVVVNHALPTSVGWCMEMGAWIVDPQDTRRLLPIGAVGELIVEGPQVARGYLGEPEKTSASFVQSQPWLHGRSQRRLYRTGDLMRYLPDASMEYCGRKDSQVKIRGCRVELGEIEYHVTANVLVKNSMVSVPKHGIYQGKLVAIVQLNDCSHNNEQSAESEGLIAMSGGIGDGFEDSIETLTRSLESKLLSQSIPEKWIIVNRLPVTKSDKIDRKKINSWLEVFQEAAAAQFDTEGAAKHSSDPILRSVSKIVFGLIAHGDNTFDENTIKSDSKLKALGISSLSVITLSAAIHKNLNAQVPIKKLLSSSLTLTDLANLIRRYASDVDADKYPSPIRSESSDSLETCRSMEDFRLLESQLLNTIESPGRRVFLTGATGYVGSYILRSLLAHPRVSKVHVLVRAQTQELAEARIIAAAKNAKWWTDMLMQKLEVWLGDLSQPDLGLAPEHVRRLRCSPERGGDTIDSIVHNGAIVHWLADYEELRPTNVASTVQLLNIVKQSACISSFVFVSSDPETHFDATRKNEELANQLSQLSGYRQTKAVSELLVNSIGSAPECTNQRFSCIKPGFVVGSEEDGVANVDDFLWRLAASVVRLGAYDSSEASGWIYVASVDAIIDRVLGAICGNEAIGAIGNGAISDGIDAKDFWRILEDISGQTLRPIPHDEWLALLRQDVSRIGSQHPLWPLLHLLEDENLTLRAKLPPTISPNMRSDSVCRVIRKGMVYLDQLRLLSSNVTWPGDDTTGEIFNRSKRSNCSVEDKVSQVFQGSKRLKN